jgi:hypothetical protein
MTATSAAVDGKARVFARDLRMQIDNCHVAMFSRGSSRLSGAVRVLVGHPISRAILRLSPNKRRSITAPTGAAIAGWHAYMEVFFSSCGSRGQKYSIWRENGEMEDAPRIARNSDPLKDEVPLADTRE